MALQSVHGLLNVVNPFPFRLKPAESNNTMDAAGESVTVIGIVALSTGPGTSKTISASGGAIYWRAGSANTFANSGTTLRIGVQDVSAGLEDGTFDVSADLVGGTDTITNSSIMGTLMETGTKTIAHGDTIAVSMELIARAGADSVIATAFAQGNQLVNSYLSADTGSGPVASQNIGQFSLLFDDGTVGWILYNIPALVTTTTFGNGSTPDEYATIFQTPFANTIVGISAILDNVASTDTFEAILYSTPLGTPVAEVTITVAPTLVVSATADGTWEWLFTSPFTPAINTNYAVAIRPTSVNTISLFRLQFGTGNGANRAVTPLGTLWSEGTRSDATGAFSSSLINLPCIGPIFGAFDDAVSAGGGPVGQQCL